MAALSTAVLTSDDHEDAPDLILRHATATVECVGGSVAVPADEPGRIVVAAAEGIFAGFQGRVVGVDGTLYGDAMAQRRMIVIENLATDPRAGARVGSEAGPTVAVPMLTELGAGGALFLCRRGGQPPFDAVDLEMLTTYAGHAALVLQLARSRHDNEQLRLADNRHHIAESLHRDVVQRLSRLGVELQGLAARAPDGESRARLQSRVDDTDQIIRALRRAIFALGQA